MGIKWEYISTQQAFIIKPWCHSKLNISYTIFRALRLFYRSKRNFLLWLDSLNINVIHLRSKLNSDYMFLTWNDSPFPCFPYFPWKQSDWPTRFIIDYNWKNLFLRIPLGKLNSMYFLTVDHWSNNFFLSLLPFTIKKTTHKFLVCLLANKNFFPGIID